MVFLTTRDRGSLCSGWEARGETREEVLEVLPGEMVDTSSESGKGTTVSTTSSNDIISIGADSMAEMLAVDSGHQKGKQVTLLLM